MASFAVGDKIFLILNSGLLFFKYYSYVSRSSKVLSHEALLKFTMKVYELAKTLIRRDEMKRAIRWKRIHKNL